MERERFNTVYKTLEGKNREVSQLEMDRAYERYIKKEEKKDAEANSSND